MKKKFNLKMKLASTLLVMGFVTTGYLNSTSAFTANGTEKGAFSLKNPQNFRVSPEITAQQGKKNAEKLLKNLGVIDADDKIINSTDMNYLSNLIYNLNTYGSDTDTIGKIKSIEEMFKVFITQTLVSSENNKYAVKLMELENEFIKRLKSNKDKFAKIIPNLDDIINDNENKIKSLMKYNKENFKALLEKNNRKSKLPLVEIESGGKFGLPDDIEIPEELKSIYRDTVKMNDSTAKLQEQIVLKQLNMIVDPTNPYGINDSNYMDYINQINDSKKRTTMPIPIASSNVDNTTVSGAYSNELINKGIINTVVDDIKPVENSLIKDENDGLHYNAYYGATSYQSGNNSFYNQLDKYGQDSNDNLYFSLQMRKVKPGKTFNDNASQFPEGCYFPEPVLIYNTNDNKAKEFCEKFIHYYLLTLSSDYYENKNHSRNMSVSVNQSKRYVPSTNTLSHPVLFFTMFPSDLNNQALMLDPSWQDVYSTAALMAMNELNNTILNYANLQLKAKLDPENGKILIEVKSEVKGSDIDNLSSISVSVKNAYSDSAIPFKKNLEQTNLASKKLWHGKLNLDDVQHANSMEKMDWKNKKGNKFYLDVYGKFKMKDGSKKYNKFLTNVANFEVGPETTRIIDKNNNLITKVNQTNPGIHINEVSKFTIANELKK